MESGIKTEIFNPIKLNNGLSKTIFYGLITSLLSGYSVTYFLTREFITNYIDLIGFNALEQYVISNESTIYSLTWSISTLVFFIVYILCLVPIILRLLYSQNKQYVEGYQKNHPFSSILIIVSIFFIFPVVAFLLAYNQLNANYSFIVPILLAIPIYLILYNENGKERITKLQVGFYLWWALSTTFVCTLVLFPFLFLLKSIDYSSLFGKDISDLKIITTLIFLWIVYSLIYGIRVFFNSIYQYIIDILIAFSVVLLMAFFSPTTILLPIVEKSGIKDTLPQIYKIKDSDYKAHIANHINNYWLSNSSIVNNCDSEEPTCTLIRTRKNKQSETDYLYLNFLTIYRDNDRHIVCPPNYPIRDVLRKNLSYQDREKLVSKCFSIPTSILLPTPLSELTLIDDKEFIKLNEVQ